MRTWLFRVVITLVALAGVVDSYLALRVHNMDPSAAPPCAVTETWDCGTVNHSRYAVFPAITPDEENVSQHTHIPVAIFGMAGYGLIALLALTGRFWAMLQLSEIAFAAACFLSYIEDFVIQKWCIYCVWSQGIATTLVVLSIVALVVRHRTGQRTLVPRPAAEVAA